MKLWSGLELPNKWTNTLSLVAIIISLFGIYYQYRSISNEEFANNLNKILVENSNRELEVTKKKLSFDIINVLYKDFYEFGDYSSEVIRKLKTKEVVSNENNLGLYLNGFEDLYEQCKRGLISREDIRVHFEYLIAPTCKNEQVEKVLRDHGNGLKLLCRDFYPGTLLANKAKAEQGSCK
jgi:hypothetical protein